MQMNQYVKLSEKAEEWGISVRRLQAMCANEKIRGAVRFGRDWMLPKNAVKPLDGRTKAGRSKAEDGFSALAFPRNTPFLQMTDLYNTPGKANESIELLKDNHLAQVLFSAEIAYLQGNINRVYESATYLLEKNNDFYSTLSAGMLLALCAIWNGDISMWKRAKLHIANAPTNSDADRDIASFSITAVDSMLYDTTSFPEWFKIGCFEPLHKDSLPAAKVFYAKYLYAAAYAVATKELDLQGLSGLTLMGILPATIEPMISQVAADKIIVSEIYLRLTCATVYHSSGSDAQAIRHIDRALALAIPDKLYGLLAEYWRVLNTLLEQRLNNFAPDAVKEVFRLYRIYNEGWSKLSGMARGKNLYTNLTQKERAVAKLAAFGLQNKEIAEKLHMSLSGVKQAVRIVSEKTGVNRREFATIL